MFDDGEFKEVIPSVARISSVCSACKEVGMLTLAAGAAGASWNCGAADCWGSEQLLIVQGGSDPTLVLLGMGSSKRATVIDLVWKLDISITACKGLKKESLYT